MKQFIIVAVAALCISCAAVSTRPNFDFANRLAQNGLWNEALYRWNLAQQLEGDCAAIHNNMAVAYEHLGRLAEAEKEYQKALALAPNNKQIKSNLDQMQRDRDRGQK